MAKGHALAHGRVKSTSNLMKGHIENEKDKGQARVQKMKTGKILKKRRRRSCSNHQPRALANKGPTRKGWIMKNTSS